MSYPSNFKLQIYNNTSIDQAFTLAGMDYTRSSLGPISTFISVTPHQIDSGLPSVLNTQNNYLYIPKSLGVLVVDSNGNLVSDIITGLFVVSSGGCYNPINNTIYFPTLDNKIVAIVGLTATIYTFGTSSVKTKQCIFCPINNNVYVSCLTSAFFLKITATNLISNIGTIIKDLLIGLYYTTNNALVFSAPVSGTIEIFDCFTETFMAPAASAFQTHYPILNPVNNKIYFTNLTTNDICILDSSYNLTSISFGTPSTFQTVYGCYSMSEGVIYMSSFLTDDSIYSIDSNNVITKIPNISGIGGNMSSNVLYNPLDGNTYLSDDYGLAIYKNGIQIKRINSGIGEMLIGVFSSNGKVISVKLFSLDFIHFYSNGGPLTVTTANGVSLDAINNEINSGAFCIDALKMIASDPDQFSKPITITKTTVSDGFESYQIIPLTKSAALEAQNSVRDLTAEDLDNLCLSSGGAITFSIKANGRLELMFKGEKTTLADILKDKERLWYYE